MPSKHEDIQSQNNNLSNSTMICQNHMHYRCIYYICLRRYVCCMTTMTMVLC